MIKIGIIGMNAGNAHPYSWSSIINGHFDANEISKAGYPGVSAYLQANKDTVGIKNAQVTHIWTQDRQISSSIAASSRIENITDTLEEMIGHVDAVILSRDDSEHHVTMARPFIDAAIPVFIDKPLTVNRDDLAYFSGEAARGKFIMSCSSMRYSRECRNALEELPNIGELELVTAVGKKDWNKYGVHLLEGIFTVLGDSEPVSVRHIGKRTKDIVHIELKGGLQIMVHLFADIALTFQVSFFGRVGWHLLEFRDFYNMFRENIFEFILSVEEGRPRLPFRITENIIGVLIAANESLEQEGRKIFIR